MNAAWSRGHAGSESEAAAITHQSAPQISLPKCHNSRSHPAGHFFVTCFQTIDPARLKSGIAAKFKYGSRAAGSWERVKFGNAAAFDPNPPSPGQRPVSCLESGGACCVICVPAGRSGVLFLRDHVKCIDWGACVYVVMKPHIMLKSQLPLAKPRKTNFTAREVEVLLNSVRKHRDTVLFGVAGGQGWAQAWLEVAKVVSTVEGIVRTESDVRKKWTYLKWEAKNTSKPGRDPTSRAVLDILTSRERDNPERRSILEKLLGKYGNAADADGLSVRQRMLA